MRVRLGGWYPWSEYRSCKNSGRPPDYRHGWMHLRVGRWHFHFSWDRFSDKRRPPTVDYDAVP
jgi:hypothetical protein